MKTKCYCVGCPKHPLFENRHNYVFYTGFDVGDTIWKNEDLVQGADVDCLEPVSDAFDDLDINPEEHDFPITAYGDGNSITGFDGRGYTIVANCENEEYSE